MAYIHFGDFQQLLQFGRMWRAFICASSRASSFCDIVCVCKQGSKMLSTWSLSMHTCTLAHTQTTAPQWVCGDNRRTGGKQSAEVYREVERGNALWFGLFCDPDSAWKAEGEWWCHYSLPSGATHTLCLFSAVKRMLLSALCAPGPRNTQTRTCTHTSRAGLGRDAVRPPRGLFTRGPYLRERGRHALTQATCC